MSKGRRQSKVDEGSLQSSHPRPSRHAFQLDPGLLGDEYHYVVAKYGSDKGSDKRDKN